MIERVNALFFVRLVECPDRNLVMAKDVNSPNERSVETPKIPPSFFNCLRAVLIPESEESDATLDALSKRALDEGVKEFQAYYSQPG